mmetsp:Transcript_89180/g.186362  ORF Transcript_89180/g.186362 Transcript_89180/m.186362 type:complete len:441 (+) Transcript_89180:97-1419(+)
MTTKLWSMLAEAHLNKAHALVHASGGLETASEVASYALVLGVLSGVSLPIAAWLGIKLSPVQDYVCAAMMAFGAGALLFAVTVELYGHSLREVQKGRMAFSEIFVTILSALLGALIYLFANRLLEHSVQDSLPEESEGNRTPVSSLCVSEHLQGLGEASSNLPPTPPPIQIQPMPSPPTNSGTSDQPIAEFGELAAGYGATGRPPITRQSSRTSSAENARPRIKALRSFASHRRATLNFDRVEKGLLEPAQKISVPAGLESGSAAVDVDVETARKKAKSVGFALFLGLLLDGVPEGILMGFLAAERHLSPVLIISLFVANFPEAFSSSTLFTKAEMPTTSILGMWSALCLLVGALAGISCFILLAAYPGYPDSEELPLGIMFLVAHIEGLTGGAMLACISSVMLPEAFERSNRDGYLCMSSGFLCTAGFLSSVFLKTTLG